MIIATGTQGLRLGVSCIERFEGTSVSCSCPTPTTAPAWAPSRRSTTTAGGLPAVAGGSGPEGFSPPRFRLARHRGTGPSSRRSNALDDFNVPEREKQEVLAAFAAEKGEVTAGSQPGAVNWRSCH